MPCNKIFAFMILAVNDFTTYRVAIYMHIRRAHEDRDLQTFFFEIFFIHRFLDHDHFAIAGCNDLASINGECSFWYPEKRDGKQEQRECTNEDDPADERKMKT